MTVVHVGALLATIAFVFVLLPRIIFPLDRVPGTFLDRIMAGAVAMSALTLAAMYVLGTLGLLELVGILVVWVVAWWLLKGRHGVRLRGRFAGTIEGFLRVSDTIETKGVGGTVRVARDGAAQAPGRWRARLASKLPRGADLVTCIAVLVVLGVAGWMRISRAVGHVELVPQDSYLALFWTTALNKGRLLADGIYPQGTYMWTSSLDRFFPFDVYTMIRYVGPIMNVLELLALYWVVSRAARNRVAGLLAIAVFGLFAGNSAMLVDWARQVGAMSQEFALAFGLVSLVYGARYMAERLTADLALAGCALFVAVTSHTLVVPLLAVGFGVIVVVGVLTRAWDGRSLTRLVVIGIVAVVAANLYLLLGVARGIPFNESFQLYNPSNQAAFGSTQEVAPGRAGEQLRENLLYQLGAVGAAVGVIGSLLVFRRRREQALTLLAMSVAALTALLLYDLVAWRFGLLFRIRQGWITAPMVPVGLGAAVGAVTLVLSAGLEERATRHPEARDARPPRTRVAEALALVLAGILFLGLFPRYSAAARTVAPSGYPQATRVSLDTLARSEALTFTFVGVSEQYQEALEKGFFTEAWVFARDVTFTDARDPSYELAIPTESVYIFAEKVAFAGPQAPPIGPTQEYYRDRTRRARIMRRIVAWCEAYRETHGDASVVYEDDVLRVYQIKRKVDVRRASLSSAFKDYTWRPGRFFDDDGDANVDVVVANPNAPPP